jgi:hypothetical protein
MGARSGLAFWECPKLVGFTHHEAQDKGYHKPKHVLGGRFFHVFLMIEKDLTPT